MTELAEILASTPWLLAACRVPLRPARRQLPQRRDPPPAASCWSASGRRRRARCSPTPSPPRQPDTGARADRAARRYNLVVPRSRCPQLQCADHGAAEHPASLSWLLLRGQCASCSAPISARYPLVELLTAVLSAAVACKLRLALADAVRRCSSPGPWSRSPSSTSTTPCCPTPSRCRCCGWACCSACSGMRVPRRPHPPIRARPSSAPSRGYLSLWLRLLGLQARSPARKAWATATSSCSARSAPGSAGRCCR